MLHSKPKLRTYVEFKSDFEVEPYVYTYMSKYSRSLFAQLRLGILPLRLETGRFVNILDPINGNFRKLNVDERTCNICKSDSVEDEKHFIFECKKYDEERKQLLKYCCSVHPHF